MAVAVSLGAIGLRLSAGLIGSYLFVWGLVAATTIGLTAAGLMLGDATSIANMVGVLAYVACLLWAFAARDARQVWIAFASAGGVLSAVAWVATRSIAAG